MDTCEKCGKTKGGTVGKAGDHASYEVMCAKEGETPTGALPCCPPLVDFLGRCAKPGVAPVTECDANRPCPSGMVCVGGTCVDQHTIPHMRKGGIEDEGATVPTKAVSGGVVGGIVGLALSALLGAKTGGVIGSTIGGVVVGALVGSKIEETPVKK